MSKRFAMVVALLWIAVVAAGCGLLGMSTERLDREPLVRATIDALAAAGEAEDRTTFEAYLASTILMQVQGWAAYQAGAEAAKAEILELLGALWAGAEMNSVRVNPESIDVYGDEATVRGGFVVDFTDAQGSRVICAGEGEANLTERGGRWVVAGVNVASYQCSEAGGEISLQAVSTTASGVPKVSFDACAYLVRGAGGEQVRALQQSLAALGYNPGPADGDFGPKTESAVRAFQSASSLYVDGEVGPKTYAALNSALAARGGYYRCGEYLARGVLPSASPGNGNTTLKISALRKGTAFESPVYIYQSTRPGPTVVFVGCIHGNEQSGHLALTEAIQRGISISRGRVVIIPAFNQIACNQNSRTLSRSGSALSGKDFNRMFPVGKKPTQLIAQEMWDLIRSQPDLAFVVDFHDGFVNSLANTLLHTRQSKAASLANKIRTSLNGMRPSGATGPKWDAYPEPISGSLIRKVGRDLGVPGILAELAGRKPGDPLSLRKQYVWRIMKMVGEEFGITISF